MTWAVRGGKAGVVGWWGGGRTRNRPTEIWSDEIFRKIARRDRERNKNAVYDSHKSNYTEYERAESALLTL